jgi:hypothetical protein
MRHQILLLQFEILLKSTGQKADRIIVKLSAEDRHILTWLYRLFAIAVLAAVGAQVACTQAIPEIGDSSLELSGPDVQPISPILYKNASFMITGGCFPVFKKIEMAPEDQSSWWDITEIDPSAILQCEQNHSFSFKFNESSPYMTSKLNFQDGIPSEKAFYLRGMTRAGPSKLTKIIVKYDPDLITPATNGPTGFSITLGGGPDKVLDNGVYSLRGRIGNVTSENQLENSDYKLRAGLRKVQFNP